MPEKEEQPDLRPEELEKLILQVEVLLAKHRARPAPTPRSVGELLRQIGRDLLAIASKPTAILRKGLEAVEGGIGALRNFFVGAGAITKALARRIAGRRARADAAEEQKQMAVNHPESALTLPASASPKVSALPAAAKPQVLELPNSAAVLEKLAAWRNKLRAQGLFAAFFEIPGHGFVIVYGRAEDEEMLTLAAIDTLRQFKALPGPPPTMETMSERSAADLGGLSESGVAELFAAISVGEFPGLDEGCVRLLKTAGVTADRLQAMSDEDLLGIPGVGKKRLAVIRKWLGSKQ